MKLQLKYFIAVNIALCLVGIVCILIGIILGGTLVRPILESIGIGLLAAGSVNILDRALTLEPPPIPSQRIEVVAEQRIAIPQEILDLKYRAVKVDIVGIRLTHVLEELINDPEQKIIERLLNHNLQFRLFMVHPHSVYLKQRAQEDSEAYEEIVKHQQHSVELCVQFYKQLNEAYDSILKNKKLNTHKTGILQIKLLEFCPYVSIYRIDEEEIYWGLYTSDKAGVNLPLFKTLANRDMLLYRHLHQHIHGLMERDRKYPDLASMPRLGPPIMAEDVVDGALKPIDSA